MSLQDRELMKVVAKTLVKAVEDPGGESTVSQVRPLLLLFNPNLKSDFLSKGITAKKQQSLLLEYIQSSNKAFQRRFFAGLLSLVSRVISEETYVPESAFEPTDSDTEEDSPDNENHSSKECLAFLKIAATCTEASLKGRISHRKDSENGASLQVLAEVYEVAFQLHNSLLSVHDCGPEASPCRNAILSLCESWWLANAVHRECLIAQVLPLLVLQASDSKEYQKSHIKKLLSFKDAFQVIDFLNPSSDSLRDLLLKIASNPLCLKLSDGRKFLTSLFRDPDLVSGLHLAFRAQIPQASKTILQAYGEIYYKAWCYAEDSSEIELQESIEHNLLQDLMHSAIHVVSPAMTKSILATLDPIHSEKKATRVADLLSRLYSPIVWRSLSAANPGIRKNSVMVLEKVFPLHDPNQNQMKVAIERSTGALIKALQDNDAKVRVAASEATANICVLFWEALPSTDIRRLLNHVILHHSSDMTSAAVRAQSLQTACALLSIPQSHAVLRPLLPLLGNLIHDKAEKVRISAVKLLRRIKQTPGIHFYHVVPVDHLSARFSEEDVAHGDPKNAVNKELTALMVSSYFPQGDSITASDQIQRTIAFLLTNPTAARAFYANLPDFLETEASAKFIAMLLVCLKSAVQKEQAQESVDTNAGKKRRRGNVNTSRSKSDENQLSASNTKLMVGLAETVCVLLQSISGALRDSKNEASKMLVEERLNDTNFVNVVSHFQQKALTSLAVGSSEEQHMKDNFQIAESLLRCVSFLPLERVDSMKDFVMDSLKSVAGDDRIPLQYGLSLLSLLANWDLIDDIGAALEKSLNVAIDDSLGLSFMSPRLSMSENGRSRRSNKLKAKDNLPELTPKFAYRVVDAFLRGGSDPALLLRRKVFESARAYESVHGSLMKAMNIAERILSNRTLIEHSAEEIDIYLLLGCCEAYGRLGLHRSRAEGGTSLNNEVKTILEWTTNVVLPYLENDAVVGSDLHGLDLSRISNVSDSLIFNSPPKQRINLGSRNSRLSEASLGTELSNVYDSFTDALACLLMKSSCFILSEFLLIGGTSHEEIESHVTRWCAALAIEDQKRHPIKRQLFPPLLRVATQLYKVTKKFDLMKQLLLDFGVKSIEGANDIIHDAMRHLLPSKFDTNSSFLDELSETLLEAELKSSEDMKTFEAVTSLEGVSSSFIIVSILEELVRSSKACKLLAGKILERVLSHRGEVNAGVLFYARLLSYLVAVLKSETFSERMATEVESERPDFENVRPIMEKIIMIAA